ncbi:uncharacterized protein FRV6_12882 [Fusarium oxysporum]|uniref:Prion-inhibition and propagation HeLo domain-containing protein n=1 Tax=Fusarium oxysporum TaxID=5507 RepID=A0A2H3TM44_FUSOX|nr:uncharacterized protein FRV6_12882 [Fusarium oxysporum]
MSGFEVPGIVLAVAGLFSSCVDAFAYFRLAQSAEREVEVALLKLDVEKARLLIWGSEVGVLSASPRNPQLLNEHIARLIQEVLRKIETLFTDFENLRTKYGMRLLEPRLTPDRVVDYVSARSLAVFRTSVSRFWARNASRISAVPRQSLAKARWAIYERERFQGLVNDVKDLVDSLFQLVNVSREIPDHIIIDNIETLLDVSQLAIVEEATEGSYRLYSEAAASARASTEAGTTDRRTPEELSGDVEGNIGPQYNAGRQTLSMANTDSVMKEIALCTKYFVLTNECRKAQMQQPCDMRYLGAQVVSNVGNNDHNQPYNVSSRGLRGGNSLGQLTNRLIGIDSKLREDKENAPWNGGYIDQRAPLIVLYIYCPPCVCLIHTAIAICAQVSTEAVDVYIRPDDRLAATCCASVDRALGVRTLLDWVRRWEAGATTYSYSGLAKYLDTIWLDCRLDHLDCEQPYTYSESKESRAMILGETVYLVPFLQDAPGRIPAPTDIWILNTSSPDPQRIFFGRFIEAQFTSGTDMPYAQPPTMPVSTPESTPGRSAEASDSERLQNSTPVDGN